MKRFIKFEENNDHEGETWFFWLQVDGNREELSKLAELLDEADTEWYTLYWDEWDEDFVDFGVEEGGWGYMNYHNKVIGQFTCPTELEDGYSLSEMCNEWFYKGSIRDHFQV